jgi:hypothetical protein
MPQAARSEDKQPAESYAYSRLNFGYISYKVYIASGIGIDQRKLKISKGVSARLTAFQVDPPSFYRHLIILCYFTRFF